MGFLDKLAKYLNKDKEVPVSVEKERKIETSAIFDKSLDFVLEVEGGYVNDQYDPGGETKFGISQKAYPHLDIKNITLEDAKAIYYRDYWLNSGAQVADISPELAFILFDAAVNMGTGTSVRLLQRALRVREDGVIGPNTRKALETANLDDTLEWTVVNRLLRYSELETWPRYRRGWLKRTVSLLRRA